MANSTFPDIWERTTHTIHWFDNGTTVDWVEIRTQVKFCINLIVLDKAGQTNI